ncbi:Protein-tyrosine phosphatase mitochondrial 1-like protein [Trachymyrmex cornetzi]|uniref:Phosphatidylglycerophosphatase and protein-tyrosine phosphatase 1 n=1 Tax=Trachymyrmex cornetzi TaxID=471704 RepID=A0A195DYV5_9HYME|nr:Protein-tyrosine phosphatase mitochondrial 1-like protein [Trachymyrmex cornetzi]
MTNTGGKVIANLRQKFMSPKVLRWFPGHMTKGLRQMQQRLKNIDCILEVHDARVPISGRYADFSRTLTGLKPHILVLSKKDLADTRCTDSIISTLNREGLSNIIFTNLKNQHCKGMKQILPLAKKLILNSQRYNRVEEESYSMMVIGVPNVGKSSLINCLRNNHLRLSGKATPVGATALIDDENIKAVVSMNEDYELSLLSNTEEEWRRYNVQFLQLSTTDIFQAPSQEKLQNGVNFINKFRNISNKKLDNPGTNNNHNQHGTVYVHCKAGRTRSATLVACYLITKNNWTPEEAVHYMRTKRPHVLLHTAQWSALNQFYARHVQPTS